MARIAAGLGKLRAQVQEKCPRAPKGEFGWIAGDEHHKQNPTSDHEADSRGIVHALDIPHYPQFGLDCNVLSKSLLDSRDKRIKYIIWDEKIAGDEGYARRNRRKAWTKYNANNHTAHMHVSINIATEDDDSDWVIGPITDDKPDAPVTSVRPTLKRGSTGDDVKLVQGLLMTDGVYGAATEMAVRQFQREQGNLTVDGMVGPATWRALAALITPEAAVPGEWYEGITTTVFGGTAENEPSAYDGHRITESELCVALPYRFPGVRPRVEVSANDKSIICTIEDVGPWNIDDPYWKTNSRPQAETGTDKRGRKTNLAGIDLSPAAARAIGISGKGLVKWRFVHQAGEFA
jgi:hypothetical protein